MCSQQVGEGAALLRCLEPLRNRSSSDSSDRDFGKERSSELNISVRNTFIDTEGTVSGLLTVEELDVFRQPRVGRAATCSLATFSRITALSLSLGDDDEASFHGLSSIVNAWRSRTDSMLSTDSSQSASAKDSDDSADDRPDGGVRERSVTSAEAQFEGLVAVPTSWDRVVPAVRGQWSVGAEVHGQRLCKPCAFLDSKKGCLSGSACLYCHLCEKGEKKRRLKEKRRIQ